VEMNQEPARGGVAMHLSGCKAWCKAVYARIMQYVCARIVEKSKKWGAAARMRTTRTRNRGKRLTDHSPYYSYKVRRSLPGAQKVPLLVDCMHMKKRSPVMRSIVDLRLIVWQHRTKIGKEIGKMDSKGKNKNKNRYNTSLRALAS